MSSDLAIATAALLLIPCAVLAAALLVLPLLLGVFAFLVLIYAWVWLLFRPSRFVVHAETLEIVWPLKRRRISRASIGSLRLISSQDLKAEIGWGARVGAGGLWGGFGWLWTQKRGIVQMYISRTDELVWIERGRERPWLVTPEHPQEFIRALSR